MNMRHQSGVLREAEGSPSGAPAAPVAPIAPAPRGSVPDHYSQDFIRGVLAERDALKSAADKAASEASAAAEAARAASDKAVREAEERIAKTERSIKHRLVSAEVRATGLAAGIAHADFLRIIDTSHWKVNDDGEVTAPEGFWAKTKADLPHLFQATGADRGTTSQPTPPPKPADPNRKSAKDMTPAEFKAAMARIAAGRAP